MPRILQVSDTHLSRSHPLFQFNFEVTLREIEALQPDLVVYTGDLALNGPDNPDDVQFAHEQIARTACPYFALPGNHDVGLVPFGGHSDQLVTEDRLAAFLTAFGSDRFVTDMGDWRLVGLNSQLIGSGLRAEEEQMNWLAEALACDSKVAVFMHYPAFLHTAQDEDVGHYAIASEPRRQLLAAFAAAGNVQLVGSGHLHQSRSMLHDGIRFEWAPSSAFVIPGVMLDTFGGRQATGMLLHELGDAGVSTQHVEPALMMNIDLRNWSNTSPHGYHQVIQQPWMVGDLQRKLAA
jgi:3',5'-cyclic AMP phosphodiesterase CpdA